MSINRATPIPLHFQIASDLKEAIKQGKWSVGDALPTEKELIDKYGVSITTVRHAMATLVNEGLLERRPGKGTFLIRDMVEENLGQPTGFFEEMAVQGLKGSQQILKMQPLKITATELEALPQLNIFDADKVYLIESVQMIYGKAVNYLRSYWPFEYGKELKSEELTYEGIYENLNKKFGVIITEADQKITAAVAGPKEARLLGIKEGAPILKAVRIGYANNRPVELSINAYRADRYSYKVHLSRNGHQKGGLVIESHKTSNLEGEP
ncbi:GntR family transcriptional regulator [Moorella naiadis]|uniref:GntR family transcriptional regulator n=1 Tax=Moorella naiadis (nom. illeg.) TaxID=3093670 RepID=UPI003D9C9CD5